MLSDKILDQHPGPIKGDTAKEIAQVVGAHFDNITGALHAAHSALKSLGDKAELIDEDGKPCNVTCVVDKARGVFKDAGTTTHKSILKLGLRKCPRPHIHFGP